MFLNIYQKLIQQCKFFITEFKKSHLLKEYSHLISDIDIYSKSLSSATNNGLDINSKIESIDFSWHERLKTLINDDNLDKNSDIYKSINYIDEATAILKTYAHLRSRVQRFNYGSLLLENEDYLKVLIETKNYPLISSIENLEIEASKIPDIISTFSKIKSEYQKSEENIENALGKIKLEILETQKEVSKSIEEKINNLFSEKIDTIQDTYQKTLILNSEVAGKIVSNDFSKSAKREKFWADWLRISGFLVLSLCAFILYKKTESLNLVDPTKISAIDYINFIKTSAVSIFLISLSILCLKESSKHRIQQYFYENQSLKILSLGPLISDIEKEKQEAVKQEVAKFLFSMEQKIIVSDDSSSAFLGMTKILEKLIDKK